MATGAEVTPLVDRSSDVESAHDWALVDALPQLPAPMRIKVGQARCGSLCSIIMLAVILLPLQADGHLLTSGNPLTTDPRWICILYIEGLLIAACVLGILYADPCTIKRTPETCFPMPPLIAEKLRQGETPPFDGVANIEEYGRVYCVRCLLWRPLQHATLLHHCDICQRCVSSFDHHCVFFGRCIAGPGARGFCCSETAHGHLDGSSNDDCTPRWPRGNLIYFRGLIVFTFLGILTCAIAHHLEPPALSIHG
jgi:hypothetical protein